jgi:integrase
MAKRSTGPWYWSRKDAWFVTVNRKQKHLGVWGKENRHEAVEAWHRLMAAVPRPRPKIPGALTVGDLTAQYLIYSQARLAAPTYRNTKHRLDIIGKRFSNRTASVVTPEEVIEFLNNPKWSSTYRACLLWTIQSLWKWAVKRKLLEDNPMTDVPRPRILSRGQKALISDEDHEKLLAGATPALRQILVLLRETGARPSELTHTTALDCQWESGTIVLQEHKTANASSSPRVLFLTPLAVSVLRPLAELYPSGPLLRSSSGRPWSQKTLSQLVKRLARKVGVVATPYGYRHSFATAALRAGLPDATVAALLGQSGTRTLHKHYNHLTAHSQYLKEELLKIRPLPTTTIDCEEPIIVQQPQQSEPKLEPEPPQEQKEQ